VRVSSDRREFMRACGRAGVGAALASAGAVLGMRSVAAGECINYGVCGGCSRFDGCGLPTARRNRESAARREGGGHV
jgi:hypothetical protein